MYEGFGKMTDTSPEMYRKMLLMYADKTPSERLKMALAMFRTAKTLVEAGIRREHANLSDEQMRALIIKRFYADDFSQKINDRNQADNTIHELTF